jgi:ABC-2 type transport system ATP-binding protein
LLIFDEPFTGFDPINTNLIKREIKRLSQEGATVIFSTHRMESVEEICDHIALINHGKVMIEGPLLELRKAHQNGTYLITTKHPVDRWDKGTLVDQTNHHTGHRYTLKSEHYPADVLNALLIDHNLVAFEEVLPSVQDIFIDVVENGSNSAVQ